MNNLRVVKSLPLTKLNVLESLYTNGGKILRKFKIMIFLMLFSSVGCSDQSIVRNLDKYQLRSVMLERADFKNWVELHVHNKLVLNELSDEDRAYLHELKYKSKLEINTFFAKIRFDRSALDHFDNLTSYLGKNFNHNEDDFFDICIEGLQQEIYNRLHRPSSAGRVKCWGDCLQSVCDTYCERRSKEQYPDNATNRDVYYSGCMDGCKNVPQQ